MNKVLSAGTAPQSHPRCPLLSSWLFEKKLDIRDVFVGGVGGLFLFAGVVSSD